MTAIYGSRDIVRNPSLLRIDENEFFKYNIKQELLKAALKIKENAKDEGELLSGTLSDGI